MRRIARLAEVGPGDRVVEIGAGLGSLTLALAETGAQVTAVEVDRGVVPLLREIAEPHPNVTVVGADAMQLDWSALLGDEGGWVLVANLPYNVATPLMCDLLDGVPQIERMLVMVQKEAAERFCAAPRTPQFGAVTVKVSYWATARIAGLVPASVFVPRPNVESRARRHPPPPRTCGRRPRRRRVPSGAHRVRATTQDAAPLAGRRGGTRGVRHRRHRQPTPPRGTRRARMGRAGHRLAGGPVTSPAVAPATGPVAVEAPAKLTLSLRITGVRDDGYHLIDAEMVSLDWSDTLTITPGGDGLTADGPYATGMPLDHTNLAAKALQLVDRRAAIHLHKRIPHGGGLGGGSSDAAAVLRWAGHTDLVAASRLGADVSSAWWAGAPVCRASANWSSRCRSSRSTSPWSSRRSR